MSMKHAFNQIGDQIDQFLEKLVHNKMKDVLKSLLDDEEFLRKLDNKMLSIRHQDTVKRQNNEKHEYEYICPECGKDHPDGGTISGCNMVYGRRGWRQLGVYDG